MVLPEIVTDKTVTPEWLNAKLDITTIESIKVQRIGEDIGHTDLVYRVHLSHKNVDNARSTGGKLRTIVMKVMDASSGHRTAFEPLNTREVRFYSEIAPLLNLDSIPVCYYAYFDKETLKGKYTVGGCWQGHPQRRASDRDGWASEKDYGRARKAARDVIDQDVGDPDRPATALGARQRGDSQSVPCIREDLGKLLGRRRTEKI